MPNNVFNNGQIIPAEVREPVVLHQPSPACMHNPSESIKSGGGRVAFNLNPNYTAYPKGIKDFLRNILCVFHR